MPSEMKKDRKKGRKKGRKEWKTVPLLDLDKKTVVKLEAQGDDLIPGMPNEISLNQILTKLPLWRNFYNLSSVNRGWLQAIRSHQVYEARVRSNSAESLAVIIHNIDDNVNGICLYSVRDQRLYDVPPIPQLGGILIGSQCVSLDGKLYVLGGLKNYYKTVASDEVYVLDLAGQRGWRRCASMLRRRHGFGCGVMNGKIYACGGLSCCGVLGARRYTCGGLCGGLSSYESVERPEVYDPEVDAWSQLPPMLSPPLFNPRVETFGEQLIVVDTNPFEPLSERNVEVYNPIEEKWQFVGPGSRFLPGSKLLTEDLMFAKGKIYSVTWGNIYVQEGQDRWTHLHSLSDESSLKSYDGYSNSQLVPVLVDDELFTLLHWPNPSGSRSSTSLVQSRGFCSGRKEIVWEDAPCSGSKKYHGLFMIKVKCAVRL